MVKQRREITSTFLNICGTICKKADYGGPIENILLQFINMTPFHLIMAISFLLLYDEG